MDYSVPLPQDYIGCSIRAIEFFAGASHFANFRHYIQYGGLNRILENNGLSLVKAERVKNGTITLALAMTQIQPG